jgi:hypothetical protein
MRTRPEVNLRLLPWRAFHPPEGQFPPSAQAAHETFDRGVPAGKTVLGHEVLPDALRRQILVELRLDHLTVRIAPAFQAGIPGGQVGCI